MSFYYTQKYEVTNPVFYVDKGKAVPVNALKAYGGVKAFLHAFLTLDPSGGNWSASRNCGFNSGDRKTGTHLVRPYDRYGSFRQ
jgi:hypothetical protein